MKRRRFQILAALAAVSLAILAVRFVISGMHGKTHLPGLREAGTLYTWIDAWSLDHGGELPARLEDLTLRDIGLPEDFARYQKRVIEYPGAGKNLKSLDKDFVILRCRAGRNDELEARVYADGRTIASKPE